MRDRLYQRCYERGHAEGYVEGLIEDRKLSIKNFLNQTLVFQLGNLDPGIRARIEAEDSLATLETWFDLALDVVDEASAQRLVEQIRNAPPAKKKPASPSLALQDRFSSKLR